MKKRIFAAALLVALLTGCESKPQPTPEPTVTTSTEPKSWEDEKVLLNELKDLVLEQEGLFNLCRNEDGSITLSPREDIQVKLDMDRVIELMDEMGLYMVYVRPVEEYFGFKEAVELEIPWPHSSDEICYSSTGAPEYTWDDCQEWIDLGENWYIRHTEQI